jgi:hypothetical protein
MGWEVFQQNPYCHKGSDAKICEFVEQVKKDLIKYKSLWEVRGRIRLRYSIK